MELDDDDDLFDELIKEETSAPLGCVINGMPSIPDSDDPLPVIKDATTIIRIDKSSCDMTSVQNSSRQNDYYVEIENSMVESTPKKSMVIAASFEEFTEEESYTKNENRNEMMISSSSLFENKKVPTTGVEKTERILEILLEKVRKKKVDIEVRLAGLRHYRIQVQLQIIKKKYPVRSRQMSIFRDTDGQMPPSN
eukprot:Trichotokara_eunicae@DN4348_c0_g1_i2.p1